MVTFIASKAVDLLCIKTTRFYEIIRDYPSIKHKMQKCILLENLVSLLELIFFKARNSNFQTRCFEVPAYHVRKMLKSFLLQGLSQKLMFGTVGELLRHTLYITRFRKLEQNFCNHLETIRKFSEKR